MTSREENVLTARSPALENENNWEEFSLKDVKVMIPGKSRYANLLTACPASPVQVIGSLDEVEEQQKHLVRDKDYLSKRVLIDNVTHYAYGQHDDGEVGVWVAGQAGWFSISPAKGYRTMYSDIIEAIDLLYFLVDRYQRRRPGRRSQSLSFEYLCDEYVGHTHGICEDGDDSAEVFDKHHSFLLTQMIRDNENVQWTETPIFKHLCEKYPEEYERIGVSHESSSADRHPAQDGFHADVDSSDLDAIVRAQAETIFDNIIDLKVAGALAKRQLNIDHLTATLLGRYKVDTARHARELIAARAGLLLEMMDNAKASGDDWSRRAIYRELKAAAENSNPKHVAITLLHRRTPIGDDSSGHESNNENHQKGRRRRVRKSLLRPKLSSVSAKKAGKQTRSASESKSDSSDNSEPALEVKIPSRAHGHDFIREPPASINGSARSILSDADSLSLRKTPLQEMTQTVNIPSSVTQKQNGMGSLDSDLPLEDTWECSVQGCGKIVSKASSKRSRELIHDHSLAHAMDTQTKLDLVFAEQRLNINIGVNHLVSRIRQIGTLEGVALDAVAVEAAPKRIRR